MKEDFTKIRKEIGNANMDYAIDLLSIQIETIGNTSFQNELLLLKAQYNELIRSELKGLGYNLAEKNRIINSIIVFVDSIENKIESTSKKNPIKADDFIEEEAWNLLRDSTSIMDFQKFISDFPESRFKVVIEIKINQLRKEKSKTYQKISFFINSCRELKITHKDICEQCGNKVYIDLPNNLKKLLDEIDIPPYNKQILLVNGGLECAEYKRKASWPAILPELSDKECEELISHMRSR
jgi:hypothetical protein